jgi:hypothetical protein
MAKAHAAAMAGAELEYEMPFELVGRECDDCGGQMFASPPPRERKQLEHWAPSHTCAWCGVRLVFVRREEFRRWTFALYRRTRGLPLVDFKPDQQDEAA